MRLGRVEENVDIEKGPAGTGLKGGVLAGSLSTGALRSGVQEGQQGTANESFWQCVSGHTRPH